MEVKRPFWAQQIENSWKKSSIIWLAGVRRSGKTTLSKSLDATYFNCDLPSVQEEVSNPELFFKRHRSKIYVFDEIHQLPEASQLLKIGADTQTAAKFLATGSSTLVASKKFKDSLTGRKRNIHFTPVLIQEIDDFGASLEKRMLHGGLPYSLLSEELDRDFFAEWMDSFYARDVQEIFAVEKRQPFLKALEYLIAANGTLFEVTKLSQASGVSRPTTIKYLDILEVTKAISVIRPFAKNAEQEIVSQPKVYTFDSGFYCHVHSIKELRNEDRGLLLENLCLENLQANGLGADVRYWRTKTKHEIDFVLPLERESVHTIECKWKEKAFDDSAMQIFRKQYTKGKNWVVTSDSVTRGVNLKNFTVMFVNIFDLPQLVSKLRR
jgi:predicted AAA+ superfamily ATPase